MCGRYSITSAPEAIRALFRYEEEPDFPPRYNIAPTQPIPIVRLIDGKCRFALMRWGLVPAWVKDPAAVSLLINARGETVCDKPAFRNAMKCRRCLIPADGFYEWQAGGTRQAAVLHPREGWARRSPSQACGRPGPGRTAKRWTPPQSSPRAPTQRLRAARPHAGDRAARAFDLWLDCTNVDAITAETLIAPAPDDHAGVLAGLDVGQSCGKRPCRPDAAERTAA